MQTAKLDNGVSSVTQSSYKPLQRLIKRITTEPRFNRQEFLSKRGIDISGGTLSLWLSGQRSTPQKRTRQSLSSYLGVKVKVLEDYLEGKITLDQLWGSRRPLPGDKALSFREIKAIALGLEVIERLELIKDLTVSLQPEDLLTSSESEVDYVEISESSALKLKNLLENSLKFTHKTKAELVDSGIDGALLSSIDCCFTDGCKYTARSFTPLINYLCEPFAWAGNDPAVNPQAKFESVEDLLAAVGVEVEV